MEKSEAELGECCKALAAAQEREAAGKASLTDKRAELQQAKAEVRGWAGGAWV